MTFINFEWHLTPRWLLRNVLARFPEQLLKGCHFTILQFGARRQIHILNCWTMLSVVPVFKLQVQRRAWEWHNTSSICACSIYDCMIYKTRCYPIHPLYGAIRVPYVPLLVTRGAFLLMYSHAYGPPSCRTPQYRRFFIPAWIYL